MPLSSDSQYRDIDIELEHRILHGIALEWRTALWVLPPKIARSMKPPVFTLKDGNRTLAHWNAEKREIAFSRIFVRNAPWDSIREVLIHEMAHQYASEILNITGEAPHGPGFQAACSVLKANPRASGTYPRFRNV
jgi:Zn-dependent protease with chaperone function